MNRLVSIISAGLVAVSVVAPVAAQTTSAQTRADVESRYQIGQMERLLEGAVEHGVTITRDRVQALTQIPMDLMVSDNAHARGFRLEGYGIFFDVIAPSFETSALVWSLNTLNQNDLGVDNAIKTLQAGVKGDQNLEQALKRLQIQMSPGTLTRLSDPPSAGARQASGSAAATSVDPPQPPAAADPILSDPDEVYRTEVTSALKDALLDHTSGLKISAAEWLTIAVKGNDSRPRLAPADTTGRTVILRLSGADLAAFLTSQIDRLEALKRIEVRVF